jgi:hypothetical protein
VNFLHPGRVGGDDVDAVRRGATSVLVDQLWKSDDLDDARALDAWGPPPRPSLIEPEDLASLLTGTHSPRQSWI